jgi:hypothetical protein
MRSTVIFSAPVQPSPRFSVFVLGAAAIAGALLLATAPGAKAAHVIYSPNVHQGEMSLEYRAHRDIDSAADKDGAQQHKLELEYVPTARWKTAVLAEWEQEPGGAFKATEVAWENIFQLTESGQHWADLGILAEYAQSTRGGGAVLELGLLAEKRLGKHTATLNLVGERSLAGGETELEYAFGWRYEIDEVFEPGIEVHGELGDWSAPGSVHAHSHSAGPSLSGEWEAPWGDGELKYTAAVLFGLTGTAPDSTMRLQLEWEF